MLHELAWVYVRLGDYQRAQRALEVLTITDPNRLDIADGSLLRADLLLRSGEFDKALTLYRSIRTRFDPIRDQVERFMAQTTDPAAYYDRLTADPDVQIDDKLPPLALAWAREMAEDENVFVVIDDVRRSRDLVKKRQKARREAQRRARRSDARQGVSRASGRHGAEHGGHEQGGQGARSARPGNGQRRRRRRR
jgi:tetratricopeptide (TPR) repeat protein